MVHNVINCLINLFHDHRSRTLATTGEKSFEKLSKLSKTVSFVWYILILEVGELVSNFISVHNGVIHRTA